MQISTKSDQTTPIYLVGLRVGKSDSSLVVSAEVGDDSKVILDTILPCESTVGSPRVIWVTVFWGSVIVVEYTVVVVGECSPEGIGELVTIISEVAYYINFILLKT